MKPTTVYGTFLSVMGTLDPEDLVRGYMAGFDDEYDVDAVVSDFRDALNALLPGSLALAGNEFVGDVDDADVPDYWAEMFNEDVDGIDIGELCERHPADNNYFPPCPEDGHPAKTG